MRKRTIGGIVAASVLSLGACGAVVGSVAASDGADEREEVAVELVDNEDALAAEEAERLAADQATAETAQVEAERVAGEAAAAEAARVEAERVAAEQAEVARVEAERIAAEQAAAEAARVEAERVAAEAAAAEAARVAAVEAARVEAERVAAVQAEAARRAAEVPVAVPGGSATYYDNCSDVRAAGADPIRQGDPGYDKHLDRDGDGIGCES